MSPEPDEARGPDGLVRCPWSLSTPEYVAYHDTEWGWPVDTVAGLYERLTLEAFQSGLAWITILRKREGFRRAFAGFDPEEVAGYGDDDRARQQDRGLRGLAQPALVPGPLRRSGRLEHQQHTDDHGGEVLGLHRCPSTLGEGADR